MIKRVVLYLLILWIWFSSWFLIMNHQKRYRTVYAASPEDPMEYGFSMVLELEVERGLSGYVKEEIFFWSRLWPYHIPFMVLVTITVLYSLRHKLRERRMINEN